MTTLKPERLDAGEFNEQPLSICGKAFVADYSGALYWPGEDALIVADLDLTRDGNTDVAGALLKLALAIDKFAPGTVICLGHPGNLPRERSQKSSEAAASFHSDDLDTLRMLQDEREWIWIYDDFDPATLEAVRGHVRPHIEVAGLTLGDKPRTAPVTHEIAGHLCPAARISLSGHIIRRPCFVGNGRRLVLPAFASTAGGRNVLDGAFDRLFTNGGRSVWMLGQEGLYPVASRLLRED